MSTEVQEAGPRVLAHGRFKLSEAPDGALWIGVATGICDRCQDCGCGEVRKPYMVPAMMMRMFAGKLKGLFGGDDDDDDGPRAA